MGSVLAQVLQYTLSAHTRNLIQFFVCSGLLEEDGSENEVKPVQQARILYRVCLDTGVYCAVCSETGQGCRASCS